MKGRASFVGAVGLLLLGVSSPAAAKLAISEARVLGPGLGEGGIRIRGPETNALWNAGIDVSGGLDDARASSIEDLGLTAAELGPKYIVTYRFDVGPGRLDRVRQDLYPYAHGAPLTYTPPGQGVAEGEPWGGSVTAGWYRGSSAFFEDLVRLGLPETNPVPEAAARGSGPRIPVPPRGAPWRSIALAVAGLLVVALTLWRARSRRLLA